MLKNLSRDVVRELISIQEGPCVSFFFPTRPFGPPAGRGAGELKNLLRRADELLDEDGVGPAAAAWLLAPVRDLLVDERFWQGQGQGLAIFDSPENLWTIRLSRPPRSEVRLGRRFALASLLPMLPPAERFYVLALSLERPRALEVTPDGTRALVLPELPPRMADALGHDRSSSEVQAHSVGPRALGAAGSVVHGQGESDEERREPDVRRYFRLVGEALAGRPDREAPIVLACVEEHDPLFRRAAGDLPLLSAIVPGSPDRVPDDELALRAWALVAERAAAQREEALGRYRELAGSRTCEDAAEVVTAAGEGRVDTLFFVPGEHRWGRLEGETPGPEIHDAHHAGDDDLVDLAVTMALARGGRVFPVPETAAPGHAALAAILRY